MKFFKYGIILERLKEEDIELVREWRNSDPVRLNMHFREIITAEQQKQWFHSINNLENNYLMIYYKGEKIGVLNDKKVDWERRTSESGIFLGKREYYSTFVPYLVSVAGIETTFYLLGWCKQYARILRTNSTAIAFNLQLGYQLCQGEENKELQTFELTRTSFEQKAGKIRKAVKIIAGDDIHWKALFEPMDYSIGLAQKFEELLREYPGPLDRSERPEGVWFRDFSVGNPTH